MKHSDLNEKLESTFQNSLVVTRRCSRQPEEEIIKMRHKMNTISYSLKYLVIFMFLSSLQSSALIVEGHEEKIAVDLLRNLLLQPATRANASVKNSISSSQASLPAQVAKPTTDSSAKPASLEPSYIESILIQAENLNLNHDEAQSRLNQELTSLPSSEADNSPSGNSQAPTDSGEDPLEATTLETTNSTSSRSQLSSATQYSVSNNATSPDSNSNNQDDDLTLVDNNRVSAIINSDNVIRADRLPAEVKNQPSSSATPRRAVSCEQAYTRCALRKVCAPALKAYNDDCQELISNHTSFCSSKCLKAMIALRSSEVGDDLVNCDCSGDEYCLQSKQRSQACMPQVEEAVNPTSVVSCSTATWICSANQSCATALDFYYRYCQSLFSQRHCSMRCNNSLSILHRQPKASKLINCQCDGSEEFPCLKYKTYTERLCLNKPAQSGGTQTGADELNPTTDDDNLNITNDPQSFVLDSPISSHDAQAENDYDDLKEVEPMSGDQDSSNGILPFEDEWIPLVSSWYFNNLHLQQQDAQQSQKQTQLQQNSNKLPKRAQRNLKQKSKANSTASRLHDNRRRHTRFSMFSSSSASLVRPDFTMLFSLVLSLFTLPILFIRGYCYAHVI